MQQEQVIKLQGGLDLVTPAISVPEGKAISVKNYEVTARGYRRCDGYEAYDGQPSPSAASYSILNFDAGTTAIEADDTVTGASSGATGIALYDATVSSGSWAGNDAAGFIVLYAVSGTFADDENLQVSAVTRAVANETQVLNGAATNALHNTYTAAAISAVRDDIAAIPGSGSVLGVHTYNGDVYAFRNNSGGTKCAMHKATTSGWVEQTFGKVLYFDAGTAAFEEDETLTGGTSGATATIDRIVTQDGTWAGTDQEGYLVLSSVSGTFQDNETITGGTSSGSATSNGTADDIELAASGRVRCVNHNFYGTASGDLFRMYGVTTNGRAFEWDGSTLTPIDTGLSDALDKPKFIGVHANHLLLGYPGGSVQHSATGDPLGWAVVDGAGELGTGEELTGIISAAATASVFFGETTISYLTGTTPGASGDFRLDTITKEAGGKADSIVMADEPMYLDNQGVRRLTTSQAFGDWKRGTLTRMVQPFLDSKKAASTVPVGAQAVRNKDQYRLYFDDGDVLVIYLGRRDPEITSLTLDFTPACVERGIDANGEEVLFCGTSDGWVYQMDKGNSFNGSSIESYIRFSWLHQGAPNNYKRYHTLRVELDTGQGESTVTTAVEYTYGDDEINPKQDDTVEVPGSGGIWDVALWDQFFWDSKVQQTLNVDLDGYGTNMSFAILSDQSDEPAHTLSSATVNFTPRRMSRRA